MNKLSTIISILFVISFANCTQKISYSDIVYNLMELNGDNSDEKLTQLKATNEGFIKSRTFLLKLDHDLVDKCKAISKESEAKLKVLQSDILNMEKNVAALKQANVVVDSTLAALKVERVQHVKTVDDAQLKVFGGKQRLRDLEVSVTERVAVLIRLRNILADELTGSQRTSTVGTFNVNKAASGYKFVELESIKESLNSLKADSDILTKSMITTLIMISEKKGGNLFANPKTVAKIFAMVEKIMTVTKNSLNAAKNTHRSNVLNLQKIIAMAKRQVENVDEKTMRLSAQKSANVANVNYLNAGVVSIKKSAAKNVRKNRIYTEICNKQSALVNRHKKTLNDIMSKFDGLRADLS